MLVLNSAARGMMDAEGFLHMVCDQTSHSPLGKMPIYCSLSVGAFVKHRPLHSSLRRQGEGCGLLPHSHGRSVSSCGSSSFL